MQKIVSLTPLRISFVAPDEHPRPREAMGDFRGANGRSAEDNEQKGCFSYPFFGNCAIIISLYPILCWSTR